MAKRTRKQKERAVQRRPATATAPVAVAGATGTAVAAGSAPPPTTAPAEPAGGRRRVERVTAAGVAAPVGRRPQRSQSLGFIEPLESDDAAIPFDRVPYVPADLRRVAIIAGVMILLIVVADIIVNNVVR